jgi:hypothetical protein
MSWFERYVWAKAHTTETIAQVAKCQINVAWALAHADSLRHPRQHRDPATSRYGFGIRYRRRSAWSERPGNSKMLTHDRGRSHKPTSSRLLIPFHPEIWLVVMDLAQMPEHGDVDCVTNAVHRAVAKRGLHLRMNRAEEPAAAAIGVVVWTD